MVDKPNVSPNDASGFDDTDVEESPESSYAESTLDEFSINEILAESGDDHDASEASGDSDLEDTGTFLPGEVLMPPEVIFSKNELDEDS